MHNPNYQNYPEANMSSGDRSEGLIRQLSYISRQNLQNTQHHSISTKNTQSKTQLKQTNTSRNVFQSGSKQNFPITYQPRAIYGKSEVDILNAENERLRQQMQQLKDNHKKEIIQLNRNISLKDGLLDDCQKEITNLKSIYQKLISQYQQYMATRPNQAGTGKQPKLNTERAGQITTTTLRVPVSPEGGMIPLSIVERGKGSGGKWSHGLIQGRK